MWYNLPKIIAYILYLMQMLVLNVSHGKYTEPEKSEKEETPLINDISGDTSFAVSIKFAS